MSTLAMPEVVEQRPNPTSVDVLRTKLAANAQGTVDPHPLVPVFIAGIIALALSSALVGSILLWLSLRHSGVMAL